MAKQTIHYVQHRSRIKVQGKGAEQKALTTKGLVNVPPHVKMVNGRAVLVAGYSYKR